MGVVKHYYERARAAYAGKADDARGIVQIVNGAAGNSEGFNTGKGVGSGLIVAANYNTTGYCELAVLNSTSMRWRYMKSIDGSVLDELVLHVRDQHKSRSSVSLNYI